MIDGHIHIESLAKEPCLGKTDILPAHPAYS